MSKNTKALIQATEDLSDTVSPLKFSDPTTHVYNPLEYARKPHVKYLEKYGGGKKECVLLGMNPGPWGMAQTGVPFGEISLIRDWLGINEPVDKPKKEHPKRPIEGFNCKRSEVSGARLWGWAKDRFGTADKFFKRFFIANYCPLVFMEESSRNRTPDKLPANERDKLFKACDHALRKMIEIFQPEWVVGVGAFAEGRAKEALEGMEVKIGRILHPSPASPAANRDWSGTAEKQFKSMGITI